MNFKIKIRISILLCFTLLFYSFQPVFSVGAASIGEPVPTDVSYWGFDENTTSSILNQGYNNILCLWDFENHEYLLVKCPDHMYYVPGGRVLLDGDYTGLFNKKDFQDYIRDQIVFNWGTNKGFFNLSASQYFTVYRVSEDGSLNSSEISEFNGIVNGTAWSASKTKYNALRWLYENDSDTYNLCKYALIWSTDSIDYAYTGSGNVSVDILNWANAVFMQNINYTAIYFTGGSSLNAAASDIPVYTFYPGGFRFTSPVVATPTPTPDPGEITFKPWDQYDNTNEFSFVFVYDGNYYGVRLIDYPAVATLYYPYAYNIGTPADSKKHFLNSNLLIGIKSSSIYKYLRYHQVDYSEEDHDYYSLGLNSINLQSLDSQSANESAGVHTPYIGSWYWYYCFKYWDLTDIRIVATNHSLSPGVGDFVTPSPSPTPTSSPTPTPYIPIYVSPTPSPEPSPGITITPTQGPTNTSVRELRGWKGALQRILQTVFVGNTDSIEGYFKDAVGGYKIVQNPFEQIVDSIYVEGSDQENFNPFENQQVDFIFDVHDQNGNIVGGEHTTNWKLTILPKTFWEWLKSYSNYFEIVFYMVDASFLGATMKRWLTKQNDEGSETKEGGDG